MEASQSPSDLTSHSDISRAWAEVTAGALSNPDRHLEHLYHLAAKDHWSIGDHDWDGVDLKSIAPELRQGLVDMFVQIQYGEVFALMGASRLVREAPEVSHSLFSAGQVNDEARHLRWFSRLIGELDCRAPVNPLVVELMDEMYNSESLEALVVGLHILVEGTAQSLFMEGARAFSRGPSLKNLSASYRGARKVLGDWLPNYVGRDESRHIAFAVHYLKERLPGLSTDERDRLEENVNRWCEKFKEAALHPSIVPASGLDGPAMLRRCVANINSRLQSVGLEARVSEDR